MLKVIHAQENREAALAEASEAPPGDLPGGQIVAQLEHFSN
jgi:hypothetical protein